MNLINNLNKINFKQLIFLTVLLFIITSYIVVNFKDDLLLFSNNINFMKKQDFNKENLNKTELKYAMNWIVITSINNPTEQIKKLSKIKGFQLVVVGDKKSNQHWKWENIIYLNIENQTNLNYKIFDTTPFNSYTRKNIGYLYAIANGAKFIYDTDDDNVPTVNLTQYFNFNKEEYGLVFDCNSPKIINPYAHFGQPLIWPRGYPLTEIHKNHYNNYICGKRKTSVVQQGVVNGDPDVDAIFRLTKTMNYKKIDIRFDDSAPSIQYPINKLVPYNSQNTFFHYEGFWSLYLPKTVSFRLSDIWRSYWAQRLLWLLDHTITFHGPNAYQLRNSHSYLKDFELEQSMYLKTEKLVEFLFKWKCTKLKFYDCVIDLSYEMAVENFWEMQEVESIKNWLQDLNEIGYIEPLIANQDYKNNDNLYSNCTLQIYPATEIEYFQVRFTPKFQKSIDIDNYCCDGQIEKIYNYYDSVKFLKKFCSMSSGKLNYESLPIDLDEKINKKQTNVTLLITFNWVAQSLNIELIKHIYGSYFKNIIFCGLNIIKNFYEKQSVFKKFDSFSFIDISVGKGGESHYYCMTKAIEMNILTDGILLMSDDVLLKYWQLNKYDINKIWYHAKLECNQKFVLDNPWNHWDGYNLNAIKQIWNYFEKVKNKTIIIDKEYVEIVNNFLDATKFNANKSSENKICIGQFSDFFYLPTKYHKSFHYISNIFRKNDVYLEVAVPTMLAGLEKNTNIEVLKANYLWPNRYDFKIIEYNNTGNYIHPSKIGDYVSTNAGKLFCENFIQDKIYHSID